MKRRTSFCAPGQPAPSIDSGVSVSVEGREVAVRQAMLLVVRTTGGRERWTRPSASSALGLCQVLL